VTQIVQMVHKQSSVNEHMVWVALNKFARAGLLLKGEKLLRRAVGLSRRQAIGKGEPRQPHWRCQS
jgi:hypothetical protein